MRNKIIKIFCYLFALLIFLFGLLIFAYPMINKAIIDNNAEENLKTFKKLRVVYSENMENDNAKANEQLDDLYSDMQEYNERIYNEKQVNLRDAWDYEQAGFKLDNYGVYNGVIGEIRIPVMDCDLPLYMGATMANMAKGAAQLGETSMPIGGVNTNCVIAAHRGASGGEFFKEIQLLKKGDKVYIDNFWDTLTYKVVEIEIINPNESDKIYIQEGRDMVTLTTCHPYPYNYQRYVVYCERVSIESEEDITNSEQSLETETVLQQTTTESRDNPVMFIKIENSLYIFVPVILVSLFVILSLVGRKKRKK